MAFPKHLSSKFGDATSKDLIIKFIDKKNQYQMDRINLPVLFGGPIYTHNMLALGLSAIQSKKRESSKKEQHINLYTNLQLFIKELLQKKSISEFLLIRGISAWSSNQLENEINNNDWFIVSPNIDIIFSNTEKNKWEQITRDLGLKDRKYIVQYSGTA